MPKTIAENDTGPEVKILKELLNRVLMPPCRLLMLDTFFDTHTKSTVKLFQSRHGLVDDGVVGTNTWKKLFTLTGYAADVVLFNIPSVAASPALPDTKDMTEDAKYGMYLLLLKKAPGDLTPALEALKIGERVILGLRVPTNTRVNQGAGAYDDRFVVLQQVGNAKSAIEFEGNTEPSSRYERGYKNAGKKIEGKDADGDKKEDLGRLRPGAYQYHVETGHSTFGNVLRSVSEIEVERDTSHDGYFDDRDVVTDKAALNAGKSVLFHKGGNSITGSAGCQTLRPTVFAEFWKALGTSKQKKFWYVLVQVQ